MQGIRQFTSWESLSSQVRSILIVHQGALGDFILALPSLETLRRTFPYARTVVMGYPGILELIENRFYADEIVSVDQKGMASFFSSGGTLESALVAFFKRFDLMIVFAKDGEGGLIGNLKQINPGRVLHIPSFPDGGESIHLTDHFRGTFSRYGFSISPEPPRLYLKESDRAWGRSYWIERGVTDRERAEAIVIHPGSGSRKKAWPVDRFIDLARDLQAKFRSKILVILGPAEGPEVERAFQADHAGPFLLAGGFSPIQLASVLEGCRFFIGNDSGVSHLAAALGVPTLAIFGPTDPKVWSPRGRNVVVIRQETPCSPCARERFLQCQYSECLQRVEKEDVLEGIRKLTAENPHYERS